MEQRFKDTAYWRARGQRAIAKSLLTSHALFITRCARMNEFRSTLRILSGMPSLDNGFARRLGDRIGRYYASEGKLARDARKLGARLDRCANRW